MWSVKIQIKATGDIYWIPVEDIDFREQIVTVMFRGHLPNTYKLSEVDILHAPGHYSQVAPE